MTIQPVANFDQVAIYYCQQRQHLEILLSDHLCLCSIGKIIIIMTSALWSQSWFYDHDHHDHDHDHDSYLPTAWQRWFELERSGTSARLPGGNHLHHFVIVMLSWLLSRSLEFYLHHHHRDFFIAFTLNSTGRYNPLIYGNDVDSVDIATRVAMVGTSWLMSLILMMTMMMTMTMMMMMLTMMMTIPRCVSSTPPTYLPTSQSTLARFAFTQGCHHDLGIMIQIICTIWSSSWSL